MTKEITHPCPRPGHRHAWYQTTPEQKRRGLGCLLMPGSDRRWTQAPCPRCGKLHPRVSRMCTCWIAHDPLYADMLEGALRGETY